MPPTDGEQLLVCNTKSADGGMRHGFFVDHAVGSCTRRMVGEAQSVRCVGEHADNKLWAPRVVSVSHSLAMRAHPLKTPIPKGTVAHAVQSTEPSEC